MKKIIIFTTIFSLALWALALPVLAEDTTAADPTATPAATYQPKQVVVYGSLTSLSGAATSAQLVLKLTRVIPQKARNFPGTYPVKDASLTVLTTDKTKVVRKYLGKADFSELAVGDQLMVTGKLAADGTLTAQLIKDNAIHKTFLAEKGEVTAVDTTASTFALKVVTKKETKEYKVYVTANTKFSKWGTNDAKFADLKVGDTVKVRGVVRQATNEITADSVVIKPIKDEIQARKNELVQKQLEKQKETLEKKIEKVKGTALEKAQAQLEAINKKIEGLKK